jgi:hypothetical protein
MPDPVKRAVWWLTDSEYRQRYNATYRPIRRRRRARRKAMPIIWRQTGGRVASGPFAGMAYLQSWRGGHFTQKLLGTYELELAAIVERICSVPYDVIVVVGAAEGYYACGLAYRTDGVPVIAFEAQPQLHDAVQLIASKNGLAGRISLHGRGERAELERALLDHRRPLVVCDIDGGEEELLEPTQITALSNADLLVEVHDDIRPGITEIVSARFAATHEVTHVSQQPRTLADLPDGVVLPAGLVIDAMDEGRGLGNDWLWIQRRQ